MADDDLLSRYTRDFQRLQAQKSRASGGVEARVLLNLAFVLGEQWTNHKNKQIYAEPHDENKLYLVFNLIDQRLHKLIGRIASIAPVFKARPDKKDPKAFAEAQVVDRMIRALDEKLDQPSRIREILWWMAIGGVAFEYVPWVPNATQEPKAQFSETNELLYTDKLTGEVIPESVMQQISQSQGRPPEQFDVHEIIVSEGDVGSEIFGPLNVFIDQSVRSIEDLAPDQAVYLAKIRTHGWLEDNDFDVTGLDPDKDLKILSTGLKQDGDAVGGVFLKDLIPLVQGTRADDDPPMNVVVERYLPISQKYPRGQYCVFVPGKKVLRETDNPYPEVPLVDYHWRPATANFWNKDYVTDLIAPQRFLNKRLSQLGEQSNAGIYSPLLGGPGLNQADVPTDYPGFVKDGLDEAGNPKLKRLDPPSMPGWFMDSINVTIKLFNDIAGGADLFEESRFPGQLRGPLAVPMLQEILDTEWGPLYEHIGQRLARVKQMRLNRVKQFYPPIRTLHFTGRDLQDETLIFHTEQILKAGTNYNVVVERGSLLPELRALTEARVRERLASPLQVLYMDRRTGRLDPSKIAMDLKFGDLGREDRASQARKLAQDIIGMLWQGEPVPPVLPFWDHGDMLDELEAEMTKTEFLRASPQIQQAFLERHAQHAKFIQDAAQQQQQAMEGQMMQSAVAQATQQTAAKVASETVEAIFQQLLAQAQQSPQTQQMMAQAMGSPRVQ